MPAENPPASTQASSAIAGMAYPRHAGRRPTRRFSPVSSSAAARRARLLRLQQAARSSASSTAWTRNVHCSAPANHGSVLRTSAVPAGAGMPVAATVPVAATASPSTVSASAHQGRKRNGLRRSSSSSLPVSRDGRSRCATVGCATTTTIATRKATRARRTVGRQAEFACTGARAKTPGSASPVATCTARSRRTGPRPFHIARSSSGVSISTGRAAVSEAGGRTRSSLSHVAPASHQSSPTTASGTSAVTATCRPGRSRNQAASSQPSQEVPQTSPVAGAAHFQPTRSIATVIAVRAKVTVNDSASSRCTDALNRSRRRSRRGVLHQPRRQTVHRSRHPVGSSGSGGRRYGAM